MSAWTQMKRPCDFEISQSRMFLLDSLALVKCRWREASLSPAQTIDNEPDRQTARVGLSQLFRSPRVIVDPRGFERITGFKCGTTPLFSLAIGILSSHFKIRPSSVSRRSTAFRFR